MDDLFYFKWPVSEGGYAWENSTLVPVGTASRSESPDPESFLRFASLGPESEDQILDFANQNGLLTQQLASDLPAPHMEPRNVWTENIRELGTAVRLWEMINASDPEPLQKCIQWGHTPAGDYVQYEPRGQLPGERPRPIASAGYKNHLLAQFRRGDAVMPAKMYLQELINDRLSPWGSPESSTRPRLLWSRDRQRMNLYIVPFDLIGFFWLGLARAIDGSRHFRRCAGCSQYMSVAREGTGNRSNRKSCSDACRTRFHTRRKLARDLRKDGKSPQAIAKQLNLDIKDVKNLLKEDRENGKKTRAK